MRRMDRYKNEDISNTSRLDKNKELYQNYSNNTIYTNVEDVVNANAFEIGNNTNKSHTTREQYQQMRKYQDIEPLPRNKKELEDVNYLIQKHENKIYDINSVLEEARKNRQPEEEEGKRKLKNKAYNILSDSNIKQLEKYREEKKKRLTTPEEEEIRELIDTIASKTLAGEISKATSVDLLSDLMATNILDKVDPQEVEEPTITEVIEIEETVEEKPKEDEEEIDEKLSLSKKILDTAEVEKVNKEKLTPQEQFEKKDTDFYTRSMDLSDKDFNFNDDFKDKQLPVIVKIFIFLVVVAIVAAAAYFIHQKIM